MQRQEIENSQLKNKYEEGLAQTIGGGSPVRHQQSRVQLRGKRPEL